MARETMTGSPREPTGGRTQGGWAPWGGRRRMLMLGVFGPILGIILLGLGIYMLSTKHGNGMPATVLGGIIILFWLVALPFARRRGKL